MMDSVDQITWRLFWFQFLISPERARRAGMVKKVWKLFSSACLPCLVRGEEMYRSDSFLLLCLELQRVENISVIFKGFHFETFNILNKFPRDTFFFSNPFLQFTAATLSHHSERTLLNSDSYCFSLKEGCSSFYISHYYLCVGQRNFSLWAAPSKSVSEGVKALTSQHPFWSQAGWSWTCWGFNKDPYWIVFSAVVSFET